MKLNELAKGIKAQIIKIETLDQKTKRRFFDMGLTKNTTVEIKKISPLGDPIDILIRGYELCLRKKDCALIEIEVIK